MNDTFIIEEATKVGSYYGALAATVVAQYFLINFMINQGSTNFIIYLVFGAGPISAVTSIVGIVVGGGTLNASHPTNRSMLSMLL